MAGVKRGGASSQGKNAAQSTESEEYKVFEAKAAIFKGNNKDRYKVYEDTGEQETVEFFKSNTNVDELISEMSSEERMAFYEWSTGYFMANNLFKSNFDLLNPFAQKSQRTFDKYLDKATLDKSIQVTRLSDAQFLMGYSKHYMNPTKAESLKGQIISSKGNLSTSAASEGLIINKQFADVKQVQYNYKIPKGSTGAGMWIGNSSINKWGARQREFMINRDTNWRVEKVAYNQSKKLWEVDLTYVSRNEHTYS